MLKKQKARSKKQITPATISLKQQNILCENYSFLLWTTVQYYLQCTDQNILIASLRRPQGTEISLTGKDIVL